MIKHYLVTADAVMLIVDAADEGRFEEVKDYVLETLPMVPSKLPLLVVANKQDKPDALAPRKRLSNVQADDCVRASMALFQVQSFICFVAVDFFLTCYSRGCNQA